MWRYSPHPLHVTRQQPSSFNRSKVVPSRVTDYQEVEELKNWKSRFPKENLQSQLMIFVLGTSQAMEASVGRLLHLHLRQFVLLRLVLFLLFRLHFIYSHSKKDEFFYFSLLLATGLKSHSFNTKTSFLVGSDHQPMCCCYATVKQVCAVPVSDVSVPFSNNVQPKDITLILLLLYLFCRQCCSYLLGKQQGLRWIRSLRRQSRSQMSG